MSTVIAPQYGRGISALEDARTRRNNAQEEIAQKEREVEKVRQALDVLRRERMQRYENTIQAITKFLAEERYREAQQATLDKIHHLLNELKTLTDEQDRVWVAKKVLHLTSWRGMKALNGVEQALTAIFNDSIPDEIAEGLARLIDKQTEFLQKIEVKKSGAMRFGKTARDRENGALRQHEQNRARRAAENRERAHGGNGKNSGQKNKK